jgi:DNA-binding LacI/PurR family transcriptional regulator
MKSVTLSQVAESAGISRTAASDILRGAHIRFRPETIERVREEASRLGYRPNGAARLMRQHNKTLIGLSVRLEHRSGLSYLVEAVHRELKSRDYHPLLLEPDDLLTGRSNAPFDDPKLLAGVLSADMLMEQELPDLYEQLSRRLPVVALYSVSSKEVDVVTANRRKVIEMAAAHLGELGHRRVAFVTARETKRPDELYKWQGWRRSVKKFGFDPNPNYVLDMAPSNSISLYAQGADVVNRLLALRDFPTALICPYEQTAISCIARLTEAKKRVPQDISVISYGAGGAGEVSAPTLTIVQQPTEQIAVKAVERLLALIRQQEGHKSPVQKTLIDPTLLLRHSTARLKIRR